MADEQKVLEDVRKAIVAVSASLDKDVLTKAVQALNEKLNGFYEAYKNYLKTQATPDKANNMDNLLKAESKNNQYLQQLQNLIPKIAMVNGQLPSNDIETIKNLTDKIQKNIDKKIDKEVAANLEIKQDILAAKKPKQDTSEKQTYNQSFKK